MSFFHGDLKQQMPFYVTRKDAGGYTGGIWLPIWMQILFFFFVWANGVLWGAIGVYEAVKVMF